MIEAHLGVALAALLAAALITSGAARHALWQPSVRGALASGAMLAAVSLWCCAYVLELTASTLPMKLLWVRLQYLGIVCLGPLWFLFVLRFTHRDRLLSRPIIALLFLIPAITLALVLTLDAHTLIYQRAALIYRQALVGLDLEYGPWFWVHTLYTYGLWGAGVLLLLVTGSRLAWSYRAPYMILVVAAFVPVIPNLYWISGRIPVVDATPIGFAATALLMGWAMHRYAQPEFLPLARDQMIEQMQDGVLVLDRRGRLMDVNPIARRLLGLGEGNALRRAAPPQVQEVLQTVAAGGRMPELWLGDGDARRCYDIAIAPVHQRNGRLAGQMAVFRDVTERQQLLGELQEALARVKTLSGLIPICASCKKVRNDAGYWEAVEVYIHNHTGAELTHGLCPDCMQRMLHDIDDILPPR